MPVPKQKRSRKRRGDRRKHLALKALYFVSCSHCAAHILPHRVCPSCGYYKGREVIQAQSEKLKVKSDRSKVQTESKGKSQDSGKKKIETAKPLSLEELSKKND